MLAKFVIGFPWVIPPAGELPEARLNMLICSQWGDSFFVTLQVIVMVMQILWYSPNKAYVIIYFIDLLIVCGFDSMRHSKRLCWTCGSIERQLKHKSAYSNFLMKHFIIASDFCNCKQWIWRLAIFSNHFFSSLKPSSPSFQLHLPLLLTVLGRILRRSGYLIFNYTIFVSVIYFQSTELKIKDQRSPLAGGYVPMQFLMWLQAAGIPIVVVSKVR